MNDKHYGWVINTYYDAINMLTQMEVKKPNRFKEFQYSKQLIFDYLDKLQHEQHTHD